jgi:Double zinc ribbon
MVPFAYFGIKSSALSLIVDLLIVFLAIIYLALIWWTVSDARRRIGDPLLVGCAFLISLVPFLGAVTYSILRPPEYLEDARERELEIRAAEARLAQLDEELCPHCDYRIERDFLRCPSCLSKLKERCGTCTRPLDPAWTLCPYCETEVPGATNTRTRRRRTRREERERDDGPDEAIEQVPAAGGRRPRREAPRPAGRSRGREGVLEREPSRESRSRDPEAVAAPDVTLVDEPLLSPDDLLGSTIEADQLPDSTGEAPERMPATDPSSSSRDAPRRPRRTRPGS